MFETRVSKNKNIEFYTPGTSKEEELWYLLNYIPPSVGYTRKKAEDWVKEFNKKTGETIEIFAPRFFTLYQNSDNGSARETPLLFHYVFLKGPFQTLKCFCNTGAGFSFVINKGSSIRYAVLKQKDLDNFRIIADYYSNRLPYYSLQDIKLEEGDVVEVADGPFRGLTGIFFPKSRSNSGKIVLQVSQDLGTVVYDINARFIRILEFSNLSRRGYDNIDAVIPKLLECLRKSASCETLSTSDISNLQIFCQRLGKTKLENKKIDAKLKAMLVASYILLHEQDEANKILGKFRKIENAVTSDSTKAFINLLFAISFNDCQLFEKGKSFLSQTEKESSFITRLREEYRFYESSGFTHRQEC